MKVQITDDKLHGRCIKTNKKYLIHHESENGEDMTSLARVASKCTWWTFDNPQFKRRTFQEAQLLENGRIKILVDA